MDQVTCTLVANSKWERNASGQVYFPFRAAVPVGCSRAIRCAVDMLRSLQPRFVGGGLALLNTDLISEDPEKVVYTFTQTLLYLAQHLDAVDGLCGADVSEVKRAARNYRDLAHTTVHASGRGLQSVYDL